MASTGELHNSAAWILRQIPRVLQEPSPSPGKSDYFCRTSDSIFVEGGNGSASVLRRMQQDRREDGQEPSQSISRGTAEANGSMMASGSISGQQGRSLGEDQSTDMDETG